MLRIQPSSADGILILQSTWLKYCTNACNTGVGELYPPMWPGFNSQSHCQRWGKLEQHLKTTYQQKIRQQQHQQGERHGNVERPSSNRTEKEPKIPYIKLSERLWEVHINFSHYCRHVCTWRRNWVLLWSLVHDFRMKIVCLHGQRSLQIALFLPSWGFGNCRWFHIFISLLHPMREFQQLLCNLWLNWSWLYCQCSVFLGEVFSMGILWRAPNSLDAIFQADKFSFFFICSNLMYSWQWSDKSTECRSLPRDKEKNLPWFLLCWWNGV